MEIIFIPVTLIGYFRFSYMLLIFSLHYLQIKPIIIGKIIFDKKNFKSKIKEKIQKTYFFDSVVYYFLNGFRNYLSISIFVLTNFK